MFHQILKELRHEKHLTQREMANELNISRVAYTNYELGNREPDFATAIKLAELFDVSIDYLLGISPLRYPAHKLIYTQKDGQPENKQTATYIRSILSQIMHLSDESRTELQKYLELLMLKDKTEQSKGRGAIKPAE